MPPETSATRRMGYRAMLASFTLVLTMSLLVAFSPQAKAYLESIVRQIGTIVISNDERASHEPDPNALPAPLPDPTSTPIPLDRPSAWTSVDQLAPELGFRPLQPAYLPDGYAFHEMFPMEYVSDDWQREGLGSFLSYRLASGAEHFLEVQQSRFSTQDLHEFPVGSAPIVDVTVRSQTGVWVEQASLDPQDPMWDAVNALIWEEDGFIFAIFSDTLPLEELLLVAQSLE